MDAVCGYAGKSIIHNETEALQENREVKMGLQYKSNHCSYNVHARIFAYQRAGKIKKDTKVQYAFPSKQKILLRSSLTWNPKVMRSFSDASATDLNGKESMDKTITPPENSHP